MAINVRELRARRGDVIDKAQALSDAAEVEDRDLTADEQVEFDGFMAEADKLEARAKRLESLEDVDLDKLETVHVRTTKRTKDNEDELLMRWVRSGDEGAIKELRSANDTLMNATTGADGEYAVPDQHVTQIMAKAGESWLAPQLGMTELPAGPGKTAYFPFDDETDVEFYSGTEQIDDYSNTFTRNSPAIGQATLAMARRDMEIPLTLELIEWEDSQLLPFLNNYIGRAFAKDQNGLFSTAVAAGGTPYTMASATAVSVADIPGIVWSLPEGYENNASWVMKKATAGKIYSLQGNDFIFKGTPAGEGTPNGPMLEFAPVHFSAQVSAVEASAKSMYYGDFSYMGYRNSGLRFQRNPFRKTGVVFLEYHYWAVYKVIISEAIKVGTHPTG